jgi:ABC-2 type transport system ATP-binding protein
VENLSRDFISKPAFFERVRHKKEIKVVKALQNVDLCVKEGELFGTLGPNGAGKTTLIKILCTLLLPTKGKAYVGGYDVVKETDKVKEIINMVAGGEQSGYGILTVRENIWMFSQLYGIPTKEANDKIDELLELFGLDDKADERVHKISTGQKQKMNICRGFVTNPKIIFLDEPTVGLDVEASRIIRNFMKRWVRERKDRTIMLTTHYMAEADELCDRIAIINDGRIIACDTPEALKKVVRKTSIFHLRTQYIQRQDILSGVKGIKSLNVTHNASNNSSSLRISLEDESVIADVISLLTKNNLKILYLSKDEPTLEDVFLQLCGRGLDDGSEPEGEWQ